MKNTPTEQTYAVIGAGPCGLSAIRCFQKMNIPAVGFELHSDVGGIWDIENPMSTVYQSAHLISSKSQMHFDEYRFDDDVAEYPHHAPMKDYFHGFAEKFDLRKYFKFNTKVINCERTAEGLWSITTENTQTAQQRTDVYKGLLVANGIFNFPNIPTLKGQENFTGEIVHSSKYKEATMFDNKRVLIVGAGNTGCDIAVDAVHRSVYVDMSVRRGYYFVPKYIFGKPADTVGNKIKLPGFIQSKVQGGILKAYTQDPVKYGFPKPDYRPFEAHPIVNSLLLHHLGHGDLDVMKDIDYLNGNRVYFKGGESKEYDMIMLATGYKLNWPFLDRKYLNWPDDKKCPQLHLNTFHPEYDNFMVLGMIEATGIGWQGRYDQAEMVVRYLANLEVGNEKKIASFVKDKKTNKTDCSGGMNYIDLERMAFYVHKETFRSKLKEEIRYFKQAL